jgi:hypothetical protein
MASVTSNGGNFPHFKPPQKPDTVSDFHCIFIESEGVTALDRTNLPVFRLVRQIAPALTLGLSLSNPTIAGEFRMARLIGYGMEDKYLVMN